MSYCHGLHSFNIVVKMWHIYSIQDTRYKIFYFRNKTHSHNTIYIDLNNEIQCTIYNDKKILYQLL